MTFRATRALPWAVAAVVAVAGLGAYFYFVSGDPLPIDTAWRSAVVLEPGSVAFTIAAFLAEIGAVLGVSACVAVTAALLLAIRQRREAATLITSVLIGIAASQSLKFLVDRPRPLEAIYVWHGSSFPSGHATGAAALAFSLAYVVSSLHYYDRAHVRMSTVRWTWVLAALWSIAMIWSRTALGVHWLSDTVAGVLLGLASAIFAQAIWGRRKRHPKSVIHNRQSRHSQHLA